MQHFKLRRSPQLVIAAAALMLPFSWALASSASAAVTGVDRPVTGESKLNSLAEKEAKADCPAGKRVVGAGGFVSGGNGEVVITSIEPQSDLKRVVVNAKEDQNGTGASWKVRATAVCADPIPGMHLVPGRGTLDNSLNHGATASCGFGERLLGGGASITSFGGGGQIKLDQINPGSTSVFAFGREDRDGFGGNWIVTPYAICAKSVGQVIKHGFGNGSGPIVNASAHCDSGQKAISGGFDSTTNGAAEAVMDGTVFGSSVVLAQSKPDQAGLVLNRTVEAVAICA
jgi:hypothetical protein